MSSIANNKYCISSIIFRAPPSKDILNMFFDRSLVSVSYKRRYPQKNFIQSFDELIINYVYVWRLK